MKKIVLTILAALCCFTLAHAVPAYRGLIPYTQPDGSVIQIRLHGDEFCHWVTDASGQVLEMDAAGYYFDELESTNDNLRFLGEGCQMLYMDSWKEAEEWLDGVVFDDPAVSDRVEKILHPERGVLSLLREGHH